MKKIHQKMKYKVLVNNGFIEEKKNSNIFFFRGHFFVDDVLYTGINAINYLSENLNFIPDNGNFSIIIITHNSLKVISDKSGSIILYYYTIDNYIIVSDKVKNILDIYEDYKLNHHHLDELKVAGFITGDDTLVDEVKSTCPGQILKFSNENNILQSKNYFEYFPEKFNDSNIEKLICDHKSIVDKVFHRLKIYCGNKQLVVPLSGGLDSRLIIHELKKNGFSNVICFSYGKKNNQESLISKKIANKLGFKWIFIEYSNEIWNKVFKSPNFKKYIFEVDNFHALPHIQDFPAVNYMKKNKLIKEDAIFIPGHTGDFISGGHILPIFANKKIKRHELVDLIIKKHFRVNRFKTIPKKSREYIQKKIFNSIDVMYARNINPAFVYEWYDWKERQQKHVLHSLRIYDYFNYNWYIPLWDSAIINFWREIPLNKKLNKKLYKIYLEKIDSYDVFSKVNHIYKKNKLRLCLEGFYLIKIIISIKRKLFSIKNKVERYLLDYYFHPMQWYGMFSYNRVISVYMFQNIYSILVKYYIHKIKENHY